MPYATRIPGAIRTARYRSQRELWKQRKREFPHTVVVLDDSKTVGKIAAFHRERPVISHATYKRFDQYDQHAYRFADRQHAELFALTFDGWAVRF